MTIHTMRGDCLELMKRIPDGSVDMILTDPPYGTTACKWDSVIPLDLMWEQLKRVIKPNAAIVMTASQPFTTTLIASNMKMFKYCWVWDKKNSGGGLLAKKQPLKITEDVVIFGVGSVNYYPQMTTGKLRNKKSYGSKPDSVTGVIKSGFKNVNDQYYPKNIIEASNANQNGKVHPTQKPIALMEYLIKTYTNENDTVLDFTMGSGTTGVACVNTSRNFIGIEKELKYYQIAEGRIGQALLDAVTVCNEVQK